MDDMHVLAKEYGAQRLFFLPTACHMLDRHQAFSFSLQGAWDR